MSGQPHFANVGSRQDRFGGQEVGRRAIHQAVLGLLRHVYRHQDRRSDSRILFVQPAVVLFEPPPLDDMDNEEPMLATTINISCSGIGLVTQRELPQGRVVLDIIGVQFMAEVRWFRRINDQLYRYGLRFLGMRE